MNCNICELRCCLNGDSFGRCGMYQVLDEKITPRYNNQLSSVSVGRVEDVPLLHYYPGALTLLIGTVSCNFDCYYCENSRIARQAGDKIFRYSLTPQEVINKAKQLNCEAVAFTVNEPAASFPYFLDIAQAARKNGLKAGCATNGYFTQEAIALLADSIDFANVSIKSWRDDFYQKSCGVPSVKPVLRNIEALHKKGVHIEITTPVTPGMDTAEIIAIARFLSDIDRKIPWHLFWLLAEYKAEIGHHVPVDKLVEMRNAALEHLDYVFIGNLVGSEWLDTECPVCGQKLVERINTFGCGSQLADYHINNEKCPNCGSKSDVTGEFSLSFLQEATYGDTHRKCPALAGEMASEAGLERKPILGLLDVNGYQKLFDFKTGIASTDSNELIKKVGSLIEEEPYPGDGIIESDDWVTHTALKLVDSHQPDLVMLNYAQPWFLSLNNPSKRREAVNNALDNAQTFIKKTGYTPLIVGLGEFEKVQRAVALEEMLKGENIVVFNGKTAFLQEEAFKKLGAETLEQLSSCWDVFTREEILSSIEAGYSSEFARNIGEYTAFARKGVCFKGASDHFILHGYVPALAESIPVYTSLKIPGHISEIASTVTNAVNAGEKVALILIEGVGVADYVQPGVDLCSNRDGRFIYQLPYQYMSIGAGKPYSQCEYQFPLGQAYWMKDYRPYPFSRRFNRTVYSAMRQGIGGRRSISVGNRNIMTHVCLEADIVVECYSCIQHNFATMAVFY
ncbi:MAG: radical SAM protein [Dehalococcoidales bacterium]|nr:radical SAM protein [Dehalococcoidales bacterium]